MFHSSVTLFSGCATALVTPFLPGGALDEPALRKLILMQMDAGVDALVLLGTTGEPCTLDMQERARVISVGIEMAAGKLPVIVGTGSNDTRRAIDYARQARQLGAQGQLCVTPYYNKATQTGLLRHYSAILSACELPMIVYNVPSRTGLSIAVETLQELSLHPLVSGVKDASGDPLWAASVIHATEGSLPVYCGNDDLIVPLMALGAKGAISVCSNVVPAQTRAISHACLNGCFDEARSSQQALQPLMDALFAQVNPIPVKCALSIMGMICEELRLPLTPLDEPHRSRLERLLKDYQLI